MSSRTPQAGQVHLLGRRRESLTKTDMMTVFGPVKFVSYDKKTQQNKLPTYLVQWIDGKLELVWPKEIATKPYMYPIDWAKFWK